MNDIYDDLTIEYLKIKSIGDNVDSKIFEAAQNNKDFYLLIKNKVMNYLNLNNILIHFDIINKKIENFNPNNYQIKKYNEKDPWQSSAHNTFIEFNIDDFIKFRFSINYGDFSSDPSIIVSSEDFSYYMNYGRKVILEGNSGFTTKIHQPDSDIIQAINNVLTKKIQKNSIILIKPFENIILLSNIIKSIKNSDKKEKTIKKLPELKNLKEGSYTNSDFLSSLKDFNSILFLTKDIQLFKESDLDSFHNVIFSSKKIKNK